MCFVITCLIAGLFIGNATDSYKKESYGWFGIESIIAIMAIVSAIFQMHRQYFY